MRRGMGDVGDELIGDDGILAGGVGEDPDGMEAGAQLGVGSDQTRSDRAAGDQCRCRRAGGEPAEDSRRDIGIRASARLDS